MSDAFFRTCITLCCLLITTATPAQIVNEDEKLIPMSVTPEGNFGASVAIAGSVAVVGAYGDEVAGNGSGSAFVYRRNGQVWLQEAKLVPPDGAAGNQFGRSVAIWEDTIVVGAPTGGLGSGKAYVFRFTGTQWEYESTLVPNGATSMARAAAAVAIQNNIVILGAPNDNTDGSRSGRAFLFGFDGAQWTQQAVLDPAGGRTSFQFGSSVAMDNGVALIGAFGNNERGLSAGAVYVYRESNGLWTEETKLFQPNAGSDRYFGYSVAFRDGVALIGAPRDAGSDGSAHVFRFDGSQWLPEGDLLAWTGADPGGWFGTSVAIDGNRAVVGATEIDANDSGSAYLYEYDGTEWTFKLKLRASDGESGDAIGRSVAIDGAYFLAGANGDDTVNGLTSGSVLALQIDCLADTNYDGMVSPADFTAWIAAFYSMSPQCDQDRNGLCDKSDIIAWIANYNAGCP